MTSSNRFSVNSTFIPNAMIDEVMPRIHPSTWVCYTVIVRQTKGWNKKSDWISKKQFMEKTGMAWNTIKRHCDVLDELGLIYRKEIFKNGGPTYLYSVVDNPELGFLNEEETVSKIDTVSKTEPVSNFDSTVSNFDSTVSNFEPTKETLTKETLTKENNPLPPKGESACAEELAQNQKANNTVTGEKNKSESEKVNELEDQAEKAKEEKKESSAVRIDYAGIANAYNQAIESTGANLPCVVNTKQLSDKRKRAIKKMVSVFNKRFGNSSVAAFNDYFADFIEVAPAFYFGENNTSWVASFDYLMRETTLEKVIERQFGGVA